MQNHELFDNFHQIANYKKCIITVRMDINIKSTQMCVYQRLEYIIMCMVYIGAYDILWLHMIIYTLKHVNSERTYDNVCCELVSQSDTFYTRYVLYT